MNFLRACLWPDSDPSVHAGSDSSGRQEGLLWYKDIGQHVNGEFSMAVVQANSLLEDQSQLESGSLSSLDNGPIGTFVGVYDGHGGPETSRFINDHLFQHLRSKCILTVYEFGTYFLFVVVLWNEVCKRSVWCFMIIVRTRGATIEFLFYAMTNFLCLFFIFVGNSSKF